MLDAEHRTLENMRPVFNRLRALALGEVVEVSDRKGVIVGLRLDADPAYMKLYLERVIGPVREIEEIDLSNLSPETLTELRGLRLVA